MFYEFVRDALDLDTWRVEAIDYEHDGLCYIAIFSGPDARARAQEYAAWKNYKARTS